MKKVYMAKYYLVNKDADMITKTVYVTAESLQIAKNEIIIHSFHNDTPWEHSGFASISETKPEDSKNYKTINDEKEV